jgi:hypothetical protein
MDFTDFSSGKAVCLESVKMQRMLQEVKDVREVSQILHRPDT